MTSNLGEIVNRLEKLGFHINATASNGFESYDISMFNEENIKSLERGHALDQVEKTFDNKGIVEAYAFHMNSDHLQDVEFPYKVSEEDRNGLVQHLVSNLQDLDYSKLVFYAENCNALLEYSGLPVINEFDFSDLTSGFSYEVNMDGLNSGNYGKYVVTYDKGDSTVRIRVSKSDHTFDYSKSDSEIMDDLENDFFDHNVRRNGIRFHINISAGDDEKFIGGGRYAVKDDEILFWGRSGDFGSVPNTIFKNFTFPKEISLGNSCDNSYLPWMINSTIGVNIREFLGNNYNGGNAKSYNHMEEDSSVTSRSYNHSSKVSKVSFESDSIIVDSSTFIVEQKVPGYLSQNEIARRFPKVPAPVQIDDDLPF